NIRDHSIIVARISTLLAKEAGRVGLSISMPLVVTAALLHDIGKTACLDNDRDHADLGRDICLEHGFVELAGIVAEHVHLRDNHLPVLTESEIVFYADKRVTHDRVVSLEARHQYILERYGNKDPDRLAAIRSNCRKWWDIEEALFAILPFEPAEVGGLIDVDPATCDLYLDAISEVAGQAGSVFPE
ncbi:MAG: HDIG domain-containing protein, partial [Desulfobulbaceae bacterium]|nr:HDIG domain-containing protein [Desulfobulbaceae bacterium]